MAKRVLIHDLSEPLRGATTAKIDISTGTGNLAIDKAADGEQLLASGTLEYMQGQDPPRPSLSMINGQAALELKADGGRRPGFRMPWSACNAETNWQIHLNPTVLSAITAHSGGGNVQLNLAGMAVTYVSADSGGGNMDLVLPDNAANLNVTAKTGAGNVTVEMGSSTAGSNHLEARSGAGNVAVCLPGDMAARIHATSGLGKVSVGPRFSRMDRAIYQSPDYDNAAARVEMVLHSGAGNVSVSSK